MSVDYTPAIQAAHTAFGADSIVLTPERATETYECTGVIWADEESRREDGMATSEVVERPRCQVLKANCPDSMPTPDQGWTCSHDGQEYTVIGVRAMNDVGWRLRLRRSLGEHAAPDYHARR